MVMHMMGGKGADLWHLFKIWKVGILVLLATMLFLRSHAAGAAEQHSSLQDFTAHLDKRIPALMKYYDIPGASIALVQNGRAAWSKAYGYADLENERRMTTDTYCRVESLSKPVTAWGVMKLVEQGKIELDNPVVQYLQNWELPESNFSEEKVTVRQLLSHNAGMPLGDFWERYSPREEMPSLEESLSKEAVLIREPGLSFSYSNTGYNLLELLIEEVTGRDFAAYMEEEIFLPLGMNRSTFTWSEDLEPAVPTGYDLKGRPVPLYVYPEKASGGLLATAEDIATFVAAGMTNFPHGGQEVLTRQNINKLYTPMAGKIGVYDLVFDAYGLGYYLEDLPSGERAVSHGCQGGGVMTHFHSVPETGDGIVILTNSQRSWPFIAYVLRDWSKWNGFSSVGMEQIIRVKKALWALNGLIFSFVLWQLWRLGRGIISKRRRFAPLSGEFLLLRLVQSGLSIIVVAGLWWAKNQDYLFITTVFPIVSRWLGLSIFFLAVVLILSATSKGSVPASFSRGRTPENTNSSCCFIEHKTRR